MTLFIPFATVAFWIGGIIWKMSDAFNALVKAFLIGMALWGSQIYILALLRSGR